MTDTDGRLFLPAEEINDISKVVWAGKLQIAQENLNLFGCFFDAITNPISHHCCPKNHITNAFANL